MGRESARVARERERMLAWPARPMNELLLGLCAFQRLPGPPSVTEWVAVARVTFPPWARLRTVWMPIAVQLGAKVLSHVEEEESDFYGGDLVGGHFQVYLPADAVDAFCAALRLVG